MTKLLTAVDTLDDRRELWHLLHRVSPARRVRFLEWACRAAPGEVGQRPTVSHHRMSARVVAAHRDPTGKADEMLTNEIYGDLLVIAAQWNLDLRVACRAAEQFVRRPGDPLPSPNPPPREARPGPRRSPSQRQSAPLRPSGLSSPASDPQRGLVHTACT